MPVRAPARGVRWIFWAWEDEPAGVAGRSVGEGWCARGARRRCAPHGPDLIGLGRIGRRGDRRGELGNDRGKRRSLETTRRCPLFLLDELGAVGVMIRRDEP